MLDFLEKTYKKARIPFLKRYKIEYGNYSYMHLEPIKNSYYEMIEANSHEEARTIFWSERGYDKEPTKCSATFDPSRGMDFGEWLKDGYNTDTQCSYEIYNIIDVHSEIKERILWIIIGGFLLGGLMSFQIKQIIIPESILLPLAGYFIFDLIYYIKIYRSQTR